jgi:hypothetical protein
MVACYLVKKVRFLLHCGDLRVPHVMGDGITLYPPQSVDENESIDRDEIIANQDALLDRWRAVGSEIKRRGVLRSLDFDLQREISELLLENYP